MAGKVRFYRGAAGTSLPMPHQDGAIFILERADTDNLGDMYVDMENGKRLHIVPDQSMEIFATPEQGSQQSALGQIYVTYHEDSNSPSGKVIDSANLKVDVRIGDGKAYIGDLPIYQASISDAVKNKVNAYLGTEYITLSSADRETDKLTIPQTQDELEETLILSREL